MTRRLILIRHTKSDWGDPFAEDHDRSLNARGRRSATALGAWLEGEGYRPEAAHISSALRTRETWKRVAAGLEDAPQMQVSEALYHASCDGLLEALRGAEAQSVAIVAHNPGIGGFACLMAETRPDHPKFAKYPTGATTILDFDVEDWAKVEPGTGKLVAFVVPRELD